MDKQKNPLQQVAEATVTILLSDLHQAIVEVARQYHQDQQLLRDRNLHVAVREYHLERVERLEALIKRLGRAWDETTRVANSAGQEN